jgi:hypothetical protein
MTASGHKRTNRPRPKSTVVCFGPIADKRGCGWFVRFVPIPAIALVAMMGGVIPLPEVPIAMYAPDTDLEFVRELPAGRAEVLFL